jgi:hypothetical protein
VQRAATASDSSGRGAIAFAGFRWKGTIWFLRHDLLRMNSSVIEDHPATTMSRRSSIRRSMTYSLSETEMVDDYTVFATAKLD